MVMEKSKLERFISKYNIGGACESVKFVSNGTEMSVRSISDDKNVLAEIISHDMSFPAGEFSIYETKKLPPMDIEIVLDEKFVNTFARAKGALSEVDTFTVTSDGTDATVVIGYSTLNTNRVNIKTTTKSNVKIDPISFSANYLKEVLMSNKEIKDGVLKVSSKGIAVAEFDGEGFTSKYYLVQIDTKD